MPVTTRRPWIAWSAPFSSAPATIRLLANLGHALWLADRPDEALRPCREAVLAAPQEAVVYRGLANVYVDLGRFEEADRAYCRSLRLVESVETAWNHSQLLVGLERYDEGYALAEARWGLDGVTPFRGALNRCSNRDQLQEGPLHLWSEQGFGDTFQHLRWLGPLMRHRCGASDPVVLEVEPCLVRLLGRALANGDGRVQVIAKKGEAAEPCQARHVSLLSLPTFLGGAPQPVDATWLQDTGWPLPSQAAQGGGLRRSSRIGVVWAAGRKLEDPYQRREYHKRSLPPTQLARLVAGLRQAGMTPVNLQFGPDRAAGMGLDPGFSEALAEDADFAEAAEMVAELDLVITVDTAMAHLVGAMARPGWILLPWSAAPRWLRGREDSPWYPSLRLFRQPERGDWGSVVHAILEAVST